MSQPQFHKLRVSDVIDETADAKSFVFDLPDSLVDSFAYKPGQFLTLRTDVAGETLLRCYSLSSAPGVDDKMRVMIKRVADGRASNALCDSVKPGDELDVQAPGGMFTPKSLDGDFLLFAGGSGITPILSILKSMLKTATGKARVIYANQNQDAIIYANELNDLVSAYGDRVDLIHWLDADKGVPTTQDLAELSKGFESAQCFICGPEAFMNCAKNAAASIGIAKDKIASEKFVSLSNPDDEPAAETAGATAAHITVHLEGETFEMDAEPGESLLATMLRNDLLPPHSCRSGECSGCMCKLQNGSVDLGKNNVLDDDDIEDGWTLACRAVPTSDTIEIEYE